MFRSPLSDPHPFARRRTVRRPQARRSRAFVALSATAALALLLAGCEVGPDFLRPSAPKVKGYTPETLAGQTASAATAGGAAQAFVEGEDIPGQWWQLYHSRPLDRLIRQALARNPTLQSAQASLREAQENLYAAESGLAPAINGALNAQREKTSTAPLGHNGSGSTFNLFNASVSVSYALDLFGGGRREVESLAAATEFQRFQLEGTYLTLTANVVTAAVQEASLRAQIAATGDILAIERQQLDIVQRQFALGGVSKADELAQQAQVAQTAATLPPLQKQLAQVQNQLADLAGALPSEGAGASFELASLNLPERLPVSLPSKLVEQRPDIRAAEATLHQASAQIGVATANELPQITLTGSLGTETNRFSDLFKHGTGVWSLGAGLLQPLFDAGQLRHEKQAAVAAYDKAAADYRTTVLAAFQNVADSLRALQYDADALAADAAAERAAAASLDIARDQLRTGAITYQTLLTAERTYEQARISLVQAEGARYADTAALFQALGGGWWNRQDIRPGQIKDLPDLLKPEHSPIRAVLKPLGLAGAGQSSTAASPAATK